MNDPWRTRRPNLPHCECCGQPIDNLEIVLDVMGVQVGGDALIFQGRARRLMRGETILMRQLILRGRVSRDMFTEAMQSESESRMLSVYACHLRRSLKALKVPIYINTLHAWGYELRGPDGKPTHAAVAAAEQAITLNGNATAWHALTRKSLAGSRRRCPA